MSVKKYIAVKFEATCNKRKKVIILGKSFIPINCYNTLLLKQNIKFGYLKFAIEASGELYLI